jgi:hypothetical protein
MLTSFRSAREHDSLSASSPHQRHGVGPMKRISLAAVVALLRQLTAGSGTNAKSGDVRFCASHGCEADIKRA